MMLSSMEAMKMRSAVAKKKEMKPSKIKTTVLLASCSCGAAETHVMAVRAAASTIAPKLSVIEARCEKLRHVVKGVVINSINNSELFVSTSCLAQVFVQFDC